MRTIDVVIGTLLSALVSVSPVLGQPIEFSDDFQTVTTYDGCALLAPCDEGIRLNQGCPGGPPGPPPKYSLIDFDSGDIFQYAASGAGSLRLHNTQFSNNNVFLGSEIWTVIGWLGTNSCPGEPPFYTSDTRFTNDQLCMYGGVRFNEFQLRTTGSGSHPSSFGPDGQPGFAGVDDDNDGVTDEVDEQAARAHGTFQGTNRGDYFGAPRGALGLDNEPGVAGVDDDGANGTDYQGEIGWPGSDDSDDGHGLFSIGPFMRLDVGSFPPDSLGVMFLIVPGSDSLSITAIGRIGTEGPSVSNSDEISTGFFNAFTQYNYVFCVCNDVYGASLWKDGDIANPAETLGPVINTYTVPDGADMAGIRASTYVKTCSGTLFETPSPTRCGTQPNEGPDSGVNTYLTNVTHTGNKNFSHTFWVIQGDPNVYYPSVTSDLDSDRDVDANDFLTFSNCFNGSLNPPKPICLNTQADLDGDGDVDANDFLTLSNCFNGALKRPKALCFPPLLQSIDWSTCQITGGGESATGAGSLLAQSAVQLDPFLFDGMTPAEEFWSFYTPTCSGQATLALCDSTGQGRSVDGIHFAFFDGTAEEATVVPATACGQSAAETVPVVADQTVSLVVYRDAGAESLDGFTLSVTCGP